MISVSPFFWPTVKTLPMDFTGDLTDYEFLSRICNKIRELIGEVNKLGNQEQTNTNAILEIQKDVENIESELQKVANGDYVSLYLDSLINYIDNNLIELVGRVVNFIVFGLSQDGHFVAMVPATWQFIHWDTILDYNSQLYGHLVLRW